MLSGSGNNCCERKLCGGSSPTSIPAVAARPCRVNSARDRSLPVELLGMSEEVVMERL